MTTGKRRAERQLRSFARNGGNWRLKGLFLAGLPTTKVSAKDVAKVWPSGNKTDYRFLSRDYEDHRYYAPDRHLSLEEGSEDYRQLSDATQKSDWETEGIGSGSDKVGTIHMDKAIKRALAFDDSIEEFDTLWREQLLDTVIQGAQKNQVARDAATVINVDTRRGDHPRGSDDRFARKVSEGGAIRDDQEDFDTVSWDATKFGEGARATEELIDHALIDVIERHVEFIGRQVENQVNRVWLTELIDNADTGNDVDASAATNGEGIGAINEAIANIEDSDFEPDSMVTHPRYTQTLMNDDNILFANQFGSDEGIRQRMKFPLLGLEGFRSSGGVYDPDGSATWDYSAADETGAVVYDRDNIGIYMYRDIEVKDYDDPIRDLQGVNARAQFDAVIHQASSAARIQQ
jgi:hypothetical protein